MIPADKQREITIIWDKYIADNRMVLDTKGVPYDDIDNNRLDAIVDLKIIIHDFLSGINDLAEFKTIVDSYNKKRNYWGFTSIKGQMFFNLLMKTIDGDEQTRKLSSLLRQCIKEPVNLQDALQKIELLEDYTKAIFSKAPDKRKAPNPGSVGYFLSYFWQIHDHLKWPVMYSSLIESFTDLGIWKVPQSQREAYNEFYELNEEIKVFLSQHKGSSVLNWEAEHTFWSLRRNKPDTKSRTEIPAIQQESVPETSVSAMTEASFDIYDYLPRLVTNLIELGKDTESNGSAKGRKYEKAVCEVFKLLGFAIEALGQGTGREPDLIAIHKEDNVAFIVDAKAYANGYALNAGDERAIREYINHYCPKLKREGIQRIGFIIVSNSFKAAFEDFSNDITWRTEIKRFILLKSEALLHLLAYRNKDQKTLSEIVEVMINAGAVISAQDIIQQFDDI